jgi:hypothetical protein
VKELIKKHLQHKRDYNKRRNSINEKKKEKGKGKEKVRNYSVIIFLFLF